MEKIGNGKIKSNVVDMKANSLKTPFKGKIVRLGEKARLNHTRPIKITLNTKAQAS